MTATKVYPIFLHAFGRSRENARWCTKVRSKFIYFGTVREDPTGELARREWREIREDLLAPTPEEIEAACEAIRATWPDEEYERRATLIPYTKRHLPATSRCACA